MITNTLARVLFKADSASANNSAPWTAGGHTVTINSSLPSDFHHFRPTWRAFVSDTLKLSVVHSFLQHSQEDDSTDPELDSEQVSPITWRQDQPDRSQQHVHDTHDHVEL